MTIKLTDGQVRRVLNNMTKEQFLDLLSEDVEKYADWICDFIWNFVDSEKTQSKLKRAFPPIQMKLFND